MLLRKYLRSFSIFTLSVFTLNIFWPSILYAGDGPKQPEVKTFTPVSTSDMVDLFTGNFNYNIPLLDVGGYPVNISYDANPSIEQEASYVGLGWNLNIGSVDRTTRGLPDDFSGDSIVKVSSKKINRTIGVTTSANGIEIFGLKSGKLGISAGGSLGVFQNNYTGAGTVVGLALGMDLNLGGSSKDPKTMSLGVGISSHSSDGLTVTPSLSYKYSVEKGNNRVQNGSFSLGRSFNTQEGWKDITLNYGTSIVEVRDPASHSRTSKTLGEANGMSSISYAHPAIPPLISTPTSSMGFSFNATIGADAFGVHPNFNVRAYYSQQSLKSHTSVALPIPEDLMVPGFITGENYLLDNGVTSSGSNSGSAKVTLPAYGYLYAHNAQSEKVLYDFNREKEGPFTVHRPNLPIPNFTHDIYTVTGQGIGGMYRPFRNDIGILHDPHLVSSSSQLDFPGLEIGVGNLVHVGANMSVTSSEQTSRKWSAPEVSNILAFRGFDPGNPSDFQPYYFKQAGEKTADFSLDMFKNVGGFDPVRIKLTGGDIMSIVTANLDPTGIISSDPTKADDVFQKQRLRNPAGDIAMDTKNTKDFRQPKNQDLQFLNAHEASQLGLEKDILVYNSNVFKMKENGSYQYSYTTNRLNKLTGKAAHHISEITAVRTDGSRYIYGIPAYSKDQKEVSFAIECGNDVSFLDGICTSGLVKYNSQDNSTSNKKGIDHSYESEETPAFPHAFLLTAVLSDDYADVKQDGPTDDDLGSYTKFNYTKSPAAHLWRTPYQKNTANYFQGFNANPNDGKASYAFGNREIWYIHSIVTKTHVAEFVLADREDAIGVADENGGPGTSKMKKLVRIDLYAKPDKLKEVKSNGAYKAVPLKSVHFVYDYSLCKGIPSNSGQPDNNLPGTPTTNQGGKLTLKKIFFTYQNSNKARLSPYEFDYGPIQPNYLEKAQDRWGTYKPYIEGVNECTNKITNTDFPYSDQNRTNANKNASAWNLHKITLPSGGIIKVDYESDDYAFVQNKPAMQMFTIAGTGASKDDPVNENQVIQNVDDYLFFKLTKTISSGLDEAAAKAEIRNRYLKGIAFKQEKLYFRCFADMATSSYDFVPGYADIDDYGAVKKNGSSDYNYGYIKIKAVKASGNEVNPITKTAINLVKMNMSFLLKDMNNVNCGDDFGSNMKDLILQTLAIYKELDALKLTYDYILKSDKSIGKKIRLNKSMIRLFNPYQNKLGGGSRVKRITISDEWDNITGNPASIYGQEYDYTMPDGAGGTMSSGVAAYEPIVGGEENPFRQPIFFNEERLGVPDEEYFLEEPMGESFFPAASVGYSRVTARDISVSVNGGNEVISYNKTGKVMHEFYTAKDFPTRVDDTDLAYARQKPSLVSQILKISVEDYVNVSQGYVVELNDMHGKPRAQSVYGESTPGSVAEEAPISSVTYKYKTDPATGALDNNVPVLNRTAIPGKNEFIENRTVGVDYDFISDMRENESTTTVVTMQGNVETFMAAIFPVIVPVIIPELQSEKVRFRSAVTAKTISRSGLLQETIMQDLGKQDTLRNVLYDAEAGDVILKQTKNQFNDPLFLFNYPAYFSYEGMGPAYKNAGTIIKTSSLEDIPGAAQLFTKGDELLVYSKENAANQEAAYFRGWVVKVEGSAIEIIDKDGFPMKNIVGTGDFILKVLRSGRRNLQGNSMGSVVTLKNPLVDTNGDGKYDNLKFEKVLEAKAVEYDDQWKVFCNCGENKAEEPIIIK